MNGQKQGKGLKVAVAVLTGLLLMVAGLLVGKVVTGNQQVLVLREGKDGKVKVDEKATAKANGSRTSRGSSGDPARTVLIPSGSGGFEEGDSFNSLVIDGGDDGDDEGYTAPPEGAEPDGNEAPPAQADATDADECNVRYENCDAQGNEVGQRPEEFDNASQPDFGESEPESQAGYEPPQGGFESPEDDDDSPSGQCNGCAQPEHDFRQDNRLDDPDDDN
jgi:hypothetical protein